VNTETKPRAGEITREIWRVKLVSMGVSPIAISISIGFHENDFAPKDPWEWLERIDKMGVLSDKLINELVCWLRRSELRIASN
jgi:hypothetical protein